jgi:Restriction endonuclease BamHI
VKIVATHELIARGPFAQSAEWQEIRQMVHEAIRAVVWPPGAESFTIYPQSGKKRDEGNGVKPIKDAAVLYLRGRGWTPEYPWPVGARVRPGNIDAVFRSSRGLVGFEWETGNVSSSHRALNKMCLGLLRGETVGGFLVVPSRKLYRFLTDRVGNVSELEAYFEFWAATPCEEGAIEVVVIEHDAESLDVPRIGKGTDGRSLL